MKTLIKNIKEIIGVENSDTKIKNFLGFKGSFISDLFFQSIGLIAYLISLTFIITGVNLFRRKEFFLIIENSFYLILYCIFGSLFLEIFINFLLLGA